MDENDRLKRLQEEERKQREELARQREEELRRIEEQRRQQEALNENLRKGRPRDERPGEDD